MIFDNNSFDLNDVLFATQSDNSLIVHTKIRTFEIWYDDVEGAADALRRLDALREQNKVNAQNSDEPGFEDLYNILRGVFVVEPKPTQNKSLFDSLKPSNIIADLAKSVLKDKVQSTTDKAKDSISSAFNRVKESLSPENLTALREELLQSAAELRKEMEEQLKAKPEPEQKPMATRNNPTPAQQERKSIITSSDDTFGTNQQFEQPTVKEPVAKPQPANQNSSSIDTSTVLIGDMRYAELENAIIQKIRDEVKIQGSPLQAAFTLTLQVTGMSADEIERILMQDIIPHATECVDITLDQFFKDNM